MEVISDLKNPIVKHIFEKEGHAAEHNFYHYRNMQVMLGDAVFPVFSGKYGIMGFRDKNIVWCYTDPVAPKEKRLGIFFEFLGWAFENGFTKMRSELTEPLWTAVLEMVKAKYPDRYRAVKPSYIYQWPIYDLKNWNTELSGANLKKLRNMRNSFSKEHVVNVIDANQVSRTELLRLVECWKGMRQGSDIAHTGHYKAAIESGFEGYDSARVILVDDVVAAINGGWKISNSNNFYSQLGIIDYDIRGIGEIAFLEDLGFLKTQGFDFADFGGSTPQMMNFKKKFMPVRIYNTVEFSIVKNE